MARDRRGAWPRSVAAVLVAAALALAGCTAQRASRPAPGPGKLAWRLLADAPTGRTEVAAAADGGYVWVAGGFGRDGATLATVERYDLARDRWERGPDLPVAVNHAMAATLDGSVYVVGGYQADGAVGRRAFRLQAGRWAPVAELPEGRAAGVAVALDGRLFVAAGVGPHGLAGRMLVYDPGGDRWTAAPGPPTPREHLGGAGFAGRLYALGGRARGQGNFGAAEAFDPRSGRWEALPDLPTRRGGLAAAATANGFVVAVGGEGEATFEQAEAFDVRAGQWRALPPLPTPRHGLGVVGVGTVLYALAGGPRPGLHVSTAGEAIDLAPLRR
jgi:non-specific serine/threonine protein kinase